ncbi:MAG: monomeric [FeFe] hydrogenase [Desulfovibrio sp.]
MALDNYTTIHFNIMVRIAKAFLSGNFAREVERIPVRMRSRYKRTTRCCVYRDRAIIKYRAMAILGFNIEDEIEMDDELIALSEYAEKAVEREKIHEPMITFLDEACVGCIQTHYETTNVCRGCMNQACASVCPKNAVTVINRKSHIDHRKCIQCGKCMKACPYNAIVKVPIPCEESCPTGAISKDLTGKQVIDYEKCIFCGKCIEACPFNAVLEKSQLVDVLKKLTGGKKLVAMIAPAIIGEFPGINGDLGKLVTALKMVGFKDVVEVAHGADRTATLEAEEFIERMEEGSDFMTSSCCPAYTELVMKHVPELYPFVSDTPTPMHFTAERVKDEDPDAITVFIGPCVAKRHEGVANPLVDHVLTFQEIEALFIAEDIAACECESETLTDLPSHTGRGFPISGGVTTAVKTQIAEKCDVNPVEVDGLDKRSIKTLRNFALGSCPGNFVEVMGCHGGCVAGPATIANTRKATNIVKKFVQKSAQGEDMTQPPCDQHDA